MTIKPVSAPTTKRVNASNSNSGAADAEGNETHVVVGGQVVGEQSVGGRETHRNVVIDQSAQLRGEVYDELTRTHRCSPHKNTRSKRLEHHSHHHHKRERAAERAEKLAVVANVVSNAGISSKCSSPRPHVSSSNSSLNSSGSSIGGGVGGVAGTVGVSVGIQKTTEQTNAKTQAQLQAAASKLLKAVEDTYSGYNSGDEHLQPKEGCTVEEWTRRDEQFAKCMNERGYELKPVEEDGACLFRSISLQIYGDEEMHDVIRQHTMDYIYKNREYFGQFVTEDINSYIKRKRRKDSHGNHIEIQAMSELYSRPVEVYCYESAPINIFNSEQSKNGCPLRLSYQRGSHYNAIIDPYNATVGIGLGLAGYKPEIQTKEAARLSEQLEIEQTMFEDKLKTTDWEATNEAIEEQIARESYLQWCRDNIQRTRAAATTSATVTSADAARSDSEASPSKYSMFNVNCSSAASIMCNGSNAAAGTVAATALNGSAAAAGLNATADHTFSLSTKSLSQLTHNLKKDVNELGGYESDATDLSSTSSVSYCGGMSPTTAAAAAAKKAAQRSKKLKKNRRGNVTVTGSIRSGTKRRHEREANNDVNIEKSTETDTPARKSPKTEDCLECPPSTQNTHRDKTPEAEQQPCTSKQSNTPEKSNANTATSSKKDYSKFYQELLEASYASNGYSEAEMLNRAIQMSTQDYIEDQKRKYLYGP